MNPIWPESDKRWKMDEKKQKRDSYGMELAVAKTSLLAVESESSETA